MIKRHCASCKCEFGFPDALEETARASEAITFYCPYGHPNCYRAGETEADKMRRERDRLTQRLAEKDDEIARQRSLRETAERSASAMKGQVTRIKNRVGNGVCPCCNRSFTNLERHMHTQHPDFTKPAANNVVQFKAEVA